LQQEFFKLGLFFSVNAGDERCYITLGGLEQNFEQGLKLFEEMLSNVKPSQEALSNVVSDLVNVRGNDKKDKGKILRAAMVNYARYGKYSSYRDILSTRELTDLKSEELVTVLHDLTKFEHTVFYYGSKPQANIQNILKKYHYGGALKPVLENKQYAELATDKKVLFVDFPMVQAEILMLSKGTEKFNAEEYIMAELYNNYFGAGLSSIVFQEIRESKALAYSANAFYTTPAKINKPHYYQAYVGTQADKMPDAIKAMQEIIERMPISEQQIENARMSILKRIESERITKSNIFFTAKANAERGYDYDMRKDVYEKMKTVSVADLKAFQEKFVKGRNYTIMVLANKSKINQEFLKTLGPIEELTLEEVFGY
jgi:predicted Zn-dependent peptidase